MKLCLNEDDCMAAVSLSEHSPGGTSGRCVVQEYIDKPLLIGGFKNHLRLYALVTSVDPLRVFLYEDGILYMAAEKYLTPAEGNLVSAV